MIDRSRSRSSGAQSPGGGNFQTGATVAATTLRSQTGSNKWTPTVAHLFVLIILEIAAFAALRYAFGVLSRSV